MTFTKEMMLAKDFEFYNTWKEYYDKKTYTISQLSGINVIGEIGVRAGYGARMFVDGCGAKKYIGFDCYDTEHHNNITNEELMLHANKLIKETDIDCNIVKINTQHIDSLSKYFPDGCDFMHIDADHKYESVMHDLEMSLAVLNTNGYILIDDVGDVDKQGKILLGAGIVRHAANVFTQRNNLFVRKIDSLTGEYLLSRKPFDESKQQGIGK